MTSEHVARALDIVRAFIAAFNDRRLADAEAMLAPDCTVIAHGREAPREALVKVMGLLHETRPTRLRAWIRTLAATAAPPQRLAV